MDRVSGLVPFVTPLALGALLTVSWLTSGPASAPQSLANQGYRALWSDGPEGPAGAVRLFRQALRADPAFPYRWSDLGEALAATGEAPMAQYCFRRAVELAPQSPQIAMRAANFSFGRGDRDSGLRLTSAVLRMTPLFNTMVFNSWIRFGGDTNNLLETTSGGDSVPATAFFRFLLTGGQSPESLEQPISETWSWLARRSYVTPALAKVWVDWLIGRRRDREAIPAWKRYVTQDPAWSVTNWIDNGGFEAVPANQGFDWRISACAGVKTGLDTAVSHTGRSSLRLNFDGTQNADFHHVEERVSLPPGRYRLSAWIRTENLTTDQGISLAFNGVSTAALTGNHDWTEVSEDVTAPNNQPATDVQIVRRRSWRFDSKPQGVVWIDDVSLRPIENSR